MAAQSYIQGALSQLQMALQDLQRQMYDLQKRNDQEHQQVEQQVNHADGERKAAEVAILQMKTDNEKQVFIDAIKHLHDESEQGKKRLSELESEIRPVLQRKNQAYTALQELMRELNGFMASPDIR